MIRSMNATNGKTVRRGFDKGFHHRKNLAAVGTLGDQKRVCCWPDREGRIGGGVEVRIEVAQKASGALVLLQARSADLKAGEDLRALVVFALRMHESRTIGVVHSGHGGEIRDAKPIQDRSIPGAGGVGDLVFKQIFHPSIAAFNNVG